MVERLYLYIAQTVEIRALILLKLLDSAMWSTPNREEPHHCETITSRLTLGSGFHANHLSTIIIRPRGITLLVKKDWMNHLPLQELWHSPLEHYANIFFGNQEVTK